MLTSSSQHIALITAAEARVAVADEERGTLARQREQREDELAEARRQLAEMRVQLSQARQREAELQQRCAMLEGSLGHADALERQNALCVRASSWSWS